MGSRRPTHSSHRNAELESASDSKLCAAVGVRCDSVDRTDCRTVSRRSAGPPDGLGARRPPRRSRLGSAPNGDRSRRLRGSRVARRIRSHSVRTPGARKRSVGRGCRSPRCPSRSPHRRGTGSRRSRGDRRIRAPRSGGRRAWMRWSPHPSGARAPSSHRFPVARTGRSGSVGSSRRPSTRRRLVRRARRRAPPSIADGLVTHEPIRGRIRASTPPLDFDNPRRRIHR